MDKKEWKSTLTFGMNPIDELFMNQTARNNGVLEEVEIEKIVPFKEHSFKVIDNEEMEELAASIGENGVINPTIAFKNEEGNLEMISGHRRMRASELAGLKTIPVLIKNISRDDAIIMMGETNLRNREKILPSEKAWTYRHMYDAIKRQAGRSDSNINSNLKGKSSRTILAEKIGEGNGSINRYICLTNLNKDLLEIVDKEIMAIRPAYEISFIDPANQTSIFEYYKENLVTPSLSQAQLLRKEAKAGSLDEHKIAKILDKPKANQKDKIVIHSQELNKYKYKSRLSADEFEKKIIKALIFFDKYGKEPKKNKEKENDFER